MGKINGSGILFSSQEFASSHAMVLLAVLQSLIGLVIITEPAVIIVRTGNVISYTLLY